MYSRLPLLLLLFLLLCAAACSFGEDASTGESSAAAGAVELGESDSVVVEDVESTSKFALSMAPESDPTPDPADAVSAAAPAASPSGPVPETAEGLDAGQIRIPIKRNSGQVRACYERELKKNPGLAGKLFLAFTIGADGKVRSARAARNSTGSAALASCVAGRVKGWVFPTAPGSTDVEYPFIFEPKGF
jgi:outer membrane biosynthesis protein TonB